MCDASFAMTPVTISLVCCVWVAIQLSQLCACPAAVHHVTVTNIFPLTTDSSCILEHQRACGTLPPWYMCLWVPLPLCCKGLS